MTIQDEITKIEAEYTVKNGIIVSPGKFEGESLATVYFYNGMLDGWADSDDCIVLDENYHTFFGLASELKYAHVYTNDSGFVYCEFLTEDEYYTLSFGNDDESMGENESNRCDSCEAMMINGVYCHETGCPKAWKTQKISCWECGCDFQPAQKYQKTCDDCMDDIENSESDYLDEIE